MRAETQAFAELAEPANARSYVNGACKVAHVVVKGKGTAFPSPVPMSVGDPSPGSLLKLSPFGRN